MHIEILESANVKHALDAWSLSRDPAKEYEAAEVMAVDAPVTEMPSALLHFMNFTILEREIFFSARNHVAWARTSRVDDPVEFTVPPEFRSLLHESSRALMVQQRANGVPQDEWRLHMPIMACTSWTARMSVRDLNRMRCYFVYLAVRTQHMRFSQVASSIASALRRMNFTPYDVEFPHYLNENVMETAPGMFKVGWLTGIDVIVPFALRAQLVRHRELTFRDNLLTMLKCLALAELKLSSMVHMQIIASTEAWRGILSHRACWIADAALWRPITKLFNEAVLPCADGHCPFVADAEARLTRGNDPNPPCPRYMNLKGIDQTPWRDEIYAEATKRGGAWVKETLQ